MSKNTRRAMSAARANAIVSAQAERFDAAKIQKRAAEEAARLATINIGRDPQTNRIVFGIWDATLRGSLSAALMGAILKLGVEHELLKVEVKDGRYTLEPNVDMESFQSRYTYHRVFESVELKWRASLHNIGHRVAVMDEQTGRPVVEQQKDRQGNLMWRDAAQTVPFMGTAYKKDEKGRDVWEGTKKFEGAVFNEMTGEFEPVVLEAPTWRHCGALQDGARQTWEKSLVRKAEQEQQAAHRAARQQSQQMQTQSRALVAVAKPVSVTEEASPEEIREFKTGQELGLGNTPFAEALAGKTAAHKLDSLGRKQPTHKKRARKGAAAAE